MKKSTLMMIGILVLVPMYFTAKVLLLKRHFYNGDLKPVPPSMTFGKWDEKNIAGVRHVVIDGRVVTSADKLRSTSVAQGYWPLVYLEQWDEPYGGVETLHFPKELRNVIKTNILHDTLFISFYNKGEFEFPPAGAPQLSIHLNEIVSLRTNNGIYKCENFANNKELEINSFNSSIDFKKSKLNVLAINAKTHSRINIRKANAIKEVSFSLSDSSRLIAERADDAGTLFKPESIDSTSVISLTGGTRRIKK